MSTRDNPDNLCTLSTVNPSGRGESWLRMRAAIESRPQAIDALPPEGDDPSLRFGPARGQRGRDVPRPESCPPRPAGSRSAGRDGHRSSPRAGRRGDPLPGHDRVRGPVHAPPAPLGRVAHACPTSSATRRPSPPTSARSSAGLGGRLPSSTDRQDRPGARVLPLPRDGDGGWRRTWRTSAWSTPSARWRTRRHGEVMLDAARARPRLDRFEPSSMNRPVPDQPARCAPSPP